MSLRCCQVAPFCPSGSAVAMGLSEVGKQHRFPMRGMHVVQASQQGLVAEGGGAGTPGRGMPHDPATARLVASALARWLRMLSTAIRKSLLAAMGDVPRAAMAVSRARPRQCPARGTSRSLALVGDQLGRGTTPLPDVASARRTDSPSVRTT